MQRLYNLILSTTVGLKMNKVATKLNNHYIPATYLYAFSDQRFKRKEKRVQPINTFNKNDLSIFTKECINHTATRKGFYINEKPKEGENPNLWEDNHSNYAEKFWFDEVYNPLSTKNVENHSRMKENLLLHIANQVTRTPLFYDETTCLEHLAKQSGVVWQSNDYEDCSFKRQKNEYMELIFLSIIKYLKGTTRKASQWTVLTNESDIPFCTSDNPVILYSSLDEPYKNTKDYYTLYFPLSSKMMLRVYALSMKDKRFDSDIGKQEGVINFVEIGEDEVRQLNSIIIKYAYREVYTSADSLIPICHNLNHHSPTLNTLIPPVEFQEMKRNIDFDRDDSWYTHHKNKNASEGIYNGSSYLLNIPLAFNVLKDIGRGEDPYIFDETEFTNNE